MNKVEAKDEKTQSFVDELHALCEKYNVILSVGFGAIKILDRAPDEPGSDTCGALMALLTAKDPHDLNGRWYSRHDADMRGVND